MALAQVAVENAAYALLAEGFELGELGRVEESIARYDQLVARFANARDLPTRELVARALISKGCRLSDLGRNEEAIAAYDDLIALCDTATDLPLREKVAGALINKGGLLHGEDALAVYEEIIKRFGTAKELSLQEWAAWGTVNKADSLRELGRKDEALAVYNSFLGRFGGATERALLKVVASALCAKAWLLGEFGRDKEALATYDDLIARFATIPDLTVQDDVAAAFINKAALLHAQGRDGEAATVYRSALDRFRRDDDIVNRIVDALAATIAERHKSVYTTGSMNEAARIQAAAELLSTVYPVDAVGKALEDLAAHAGRSTTQRATAKPRAKWENRTGADADLSPPEFTAKHYAAEMANGTLHRGVIAQEDKPLAVKLASWLRSKPMPEGIDIPTKPEWITRQAEAGKAKQASAVRPRTEGQRIYDALRNRRRRESSLQM
jgi:tetratricopeptide (TPR) repeat protein